MIQHRNPDSLKAFPKSIFWTTKYISPLTDIHVSSFKYKGKEYRDVTAHIAGCMHNWRCFSADYFDNRKEFLDIIKPDKTYIYIEQQHWLKLMLWTLQYNVMEHTIGYIPLLLEKLTPEKEIYLEENHCRLWHIWQWASAEYNKYCLKPWVGRYWKAWVMNVPKSKLKVF